MATTTATKKGNNTTFNANDGLNIATPAAEAVAVGVDVEVDIVVDVERVDWTGLARAINKIGYKNILQIIPEGSYGGTFFVIIYKVK